MLGNTARKSEVATPPWRIDERLLTEQRWARVEARPLDSAASLLPILKELQEEDCAHTWREYVNDGGAVSIDTAKHLIAEEQRLRPTTFFIYVAVLDSGEEHTLAAATVSDCVNTAFSHDGFPVLARCYVRGAFRGIGLYAETLKHRLAYCQSRWGNALNAVHMGTGSPEVWETAMVKRGLALPFTCLGEQDLKAGAQTHRVKALLAVTSVFRDGILAEARKNGFSDEFPGMLQNLLQGNRPDCWPSIRAEAVRHGYGQPGATFPDALMQLINLGDAIPLVLPK